MNSQHSPKRRDFLKKSALLAAAGGTPLALQLASMSEAVAQVSSNDYKALVCIFLYGGNDAFNTVVPIDSSYKAYATARGALALAKESLKPLGPVISGRQFGLHEKLDPLAGLFNTDGKLAVLMNVGPLLKAGTNGGNWNQPGYEPPKLGSHNDQQSIWQSMQVEGATSGWGGRLADKFLQSNGTASSFTCINTAGNAVFLSGQQALPYFVYGGGAAVLESKVFGSTSLPAVMQEIATRTSGVQHLFEREHALIMRRAIANGKTFNAALPPEEVASGFDTSSELAKKFPLAMQLQTVARTIAAQSTLGVGRQVFFVGLRGFDTHDTQISRHDQLLGVLGGAMKAFYAATEALGVSSAVTTFTASDFGRNLTVNGDGTDHGWGAHHFVMGGAVNGGRFYGQAPQIRNDGNNIWFGNQDAGNGKLIPTTSIEQLGVRLGRWFGVPENDLTNSTSGIFSNATAFNLSTLDGLLR